MQIKRKKGNVKFFKPLRMQERQEIDWKCSIENWDTISKETASLIFSQGETLLKETVETAKIISNKADRVFSILLPIASAILIYLIKAFPTHKVNFLTFSGGLILFVLGVSLWYCYKNFHAFSLAVPGTYPKLTLSPDFINTTFNDNQQYLNMMIAIAETIQKGILLNEAVNIERTKIGRASCRERVLVQV